jgi:hypothetical protein
MGLVDPLNPMQGQTCPRVWPMPLSKGLLLGKYSPISPWQTTWSSIQAKKTFGVVRWFSKVSIQKAQHGLSTQLIKASSCIDELNYRIRAEELRNFSSHQTLTMERNC